MSDEQYSDADRIDWLTRAAKTCTVYMDGQHPWDLTGNYRLRDMKGPTFRDALDAVMRRDNHIAAALLEKGGEVREELKSCHADTDVMAGLRSAMEIELVNKSELVEKALRRAYGLGQLWMESAPPRAAGMADRLAVSGMFGLLVTDTLAALIDAGLLAAVEGWRDIESAPKDGTEILICGGTIDCDNGGSGSNGALPFNGVGTVYWRKRGCWGGWCGGYASEYDSEYWHKPTHWQPLPAAMTKESAE